MANAQTHKSLSMKLVNVPDFDIAACLGEGTPI